VGFLDDDGILLDLGDSAMAVKKEKEIPILADTLTQILSSRIKLTEDERRVVTALRDSLNKFIAKKVVKNDG